MYTTCTQHVNVHVYKWQSRLPSRNRILLHNLTMLSCSRHCSTEPVKGRANMHTIDSWTPTQDCHTYKSAPYPLSLFPLLCTFISSSLIHSLSPPPSPPLLLLYLHPPLPHSPLQRWSLGSLVNGPLINEVIPWALPLQPLVFAVHGASSLRPIITVHRVQEVQTATARLVKHTANGSMWPYPRSMWPYPTQIHTHIRPIAYMDLCTRSLPPFYAVTNTWEIWQSQQLPRLSGRTAALLNMYFRKSAALVLILSR